MVVNRPPDYSESVALEKKQPKTQKGLGKSVVKIYECKSYNKREKEHTVYFIILKMLTLKRNQTLWTIKSGSLPPDISGLFPCACFAAEFDKHVTLCGQTLKGLCYVVCPVSHSTKKLKHVQGK